MFRISGGKGTRPEAIYEASNKGKPAVIYWHGFMASSDDAICDGDVSLAFVLADAGFDVWLPNTRGNVHSKNHRFCDEEQKEFWDFSFEEVADYDLPSTIEFVLKTTGNQKVSYIGHSFGNTIMFAALSEKVEWYRERLNLFVAVAPTTQLNNVISKIIKSAAGNALVHKLLESNDKGVYTHPKAESKLMAFFLKAINYDDVALDMVTDDHPDKILDSTKITWLGHFPCGTSAKSLQHTLQIVEDSNFARFNYGKAGNMKRYN